MAKTAHNAVIGTLVYESFKPMNPGRVMSIKPPGPNNVSGEDWLTVLHLNGKTKEYLRTHLMNFESLVEDHRRKYEKFSDMAKKL